jgi:hypothetical protein
MLEKRKRIDEIETRATEDGSGDGICDDFTENDKHVNWN